MRVGNGYDAHRVVAGRELWLGCVHFTGSDVGLEGHSDADVVAHAVCDALLGAAGLGDIGEHFPDADPKFKNYPGAGFLSGVAEMVREAGYKIANIDCVVLCEIVRLGDTKKEMAEAMAGHLGVDVSCVNVKATTNEGRGAVGRREIVACEAVAALERT